LWNRALERYREELEEVDDREILAGPGSLDDLVNYAKTIEPLVPSERTALTTFNRLKPILKFVDDFSAVIAVCFGVDARLTAFFGGSIRLIITPASSAGETLQNALDMLEELSLTLPRFRQYEETLPIDKNFENALLDVYTEIICFYARSIHFFRSHPHLPLCRTAWKDFQGDFERTVKLDKRMSAAVEKEADFARMKVDDYKYGEVLKLLRSLKDSKMTDDSIVKCYHIPPSSITSPRFFRRQADLQAVRQALDPSESVDILKSYAVYGMGGVGKTQLALHYAQASKRTFDSVLWIAAGNLMSMEQSFEDVAQAPGLVQTKNDPADALPATLRVKNWLAASGMFFEEENSVFAGC
jgi:NB-ARC domain